jgi:dGTPase
MEWFEHEDEQLAPYAMCGRQSRGRVHPEPPHPFRTIYQRDRERIVHSTAFRRLMGKTQVLVGQINDHHRTRLTHTLEVAQISRTIARRLCLNEDLTEAIALAHDLGHPPFGHAGEAALNECLKEFGGFDHNVYGLRRVDSLEERYPDFPGLNLSWEVREAFIQHSRRRDLPKYAEFFAVGQPLLEAQVVDAADSLAYDTHDTEDALAIGLIEIDDLNGVEFWRRIADSIRRTYSNLPGDLFRRAVIRQMIAEQVDDLIMETERRISEHPLDSVQAVRAQTGAIVAFAPELMRRKAALEEFLRERVYKHYLVQRMATKGKRFLNRLFVEFVRCPELLPASHLARCEGVCPGRWGTAAHVIPEWGGREPRIEQVVADYLAGMTDRFAQQEYLRLFHPDQD